MTVKDIIETPLSDTQSVMAIMNETGDYKVVWDRTKMDEVAAARSQFENWRKKGYMAYKVEGKDASKGEILHEFDEQAQSIIFAPRMKGGV